MNEFDYVGQFKDNKIVLYLKKGHYDFVESFTCFNGYSVFENHPCNDVYNDANKEIVDWKKKIKLFATSVV